jgi:hypothetical protein
VSRRKKREWFKVTSDAWIPSLSNLTCSQRDGFQSQRKEAQGQKGSS